MGVRYIIRQTKLAVSQAIANEQNGSFQEL